MNRVEPSFGYYYYPDLNKVEACEKISHYGLFSTFTLLLSTITIIHRDYKKLPTEFDLKNALMKFKSNKEEDLYKTFFKINEEIHIDNIVTIGPDSHHTVYNENTIERLFPYIKRYFTLNDEMSKVKKQLMEKYSIELGNYISIIYRGTDKFTDRGGFMSVNCIAYEKMYNEITNNDSSKNKTLFIQTEEPRVVDYFTKKLKAKYINETDIGLIDKTSTPVPKLNVDEWIKNYVVSIFIHSQANKLITYTGNSGFFAVLFRGNMKDVHQEMTFNLDKKLFFNTK